MNRIKELRLRCKETQEQLAKEIGVGRSVVGMWETGKSNPDLEGLRKLAVYFNVSADYILGLSDQMTALDGEKPVRGGEELDSYLEELRDRKEMRMLFKLAKGATKEDVEKAVKIIEALRS